MIKKRRAAVICGILCVALVLTGCVGVHKDPDINTVSGSEKAEEAVSEAGLEDIALRTLETVKSFPTEEALTAFGGANADTEEMHALSEMIDAVEAEGKFVSFVVVNTATGKGFSYNADRPGTVQSTVKAPYVVSLIMENETILETEKERIKKIITYSDNDCYETLREEYGDEAFFDLCAKAGVEETKASQLYPRNMSVRELLQFWCLMYPMIRGNVGKDTERGIFSGYFRNTAYSSFSTMLWRDCDVFSKAGWEDGLRNDESGILGTSPEPSMLDGDPANDEIATNDSGIVCAPNGDYLFAFFSNYPAVPEHVLYLVEAIHQAELAM